MIFLMLVIVILPFIDLPVTAFHRNTAPVVVHARATSGLSAAVQLSLIFHFPVADALLFSRAPGAFIAAAGANFLPIRLRSIRC